MNDREAIGRCIAGCVRAKDGQVLLPGTFPGIGVFGGKKPA